MDKRSNSTGYSTTPTSNNNNNRDHSLRQLNKLSRKISKPSSSSSSSSSISSAVNQEIDFLPPSHQGNLHQHQPPVSKWTHDVFPSFRGEDVRRNFLSHIQKEFRRKGIIPFFDNEIKRGESIGPELVQAIRKSKVAVVLLSRNYASSTWCLDELAEIMKYKKEFGKIEVFAVFYEVDPSDVTKLTGEFGAIFRKTCAGRKIEDVGRWSQAFAEVATIAGYVSRNWNNEAVMIENIVAEISKRLINSTPPAKYFEDLIGMESHMEVMKRLLCLGSDEVRMIGIWGPAGIGKTTIARVTYDQVCSGFQLSVFMKMKPSYVRPTCSDDYDERLYLQQQFLSQLTNQKDLKISHLGAAQEFLMGKKVLVIFDGVEQLVQLLTMPEAQYFGHGSRIIVTTQNLRLLNAIKIDHFYKVNYPPPDKALQILCMSAFGQTFPKDGFEKLAWEVTKRAGSLPLGLRIMGSHLRGMSKEEWEEELPRLRICLDGGIGSILKLTYDALGEEDKYLFLHIACFFNEEDLNDGTFEDVLRHKFSNMRQGLQVLVQRSLLSMDAIFDKRISATHDLLIQLGREIVRNKFIDEPGKRQFLVDIKDIYEVLNDNTGNKSVIGIDLDISEIEDDLHISEKAFEDLSNLQLLRFNQGFGHQIRLHFSQGLNCLPPKLRILHWNCYPMESLPSNFNPKFLVKIKLDYSKLEKLWEGIYPLGNLKLMDLSYSRNLKELPDLSSATNLIYLDLSCCSNVVGLPSSFGNLASLEFLLLGECSNVVELPSSIGNLTNLEYLDLSECSNLVELPSSIGNLVNLKTLKLRGCSSLLKLPFSIGNLSNLRNLCLKGCSNLELLSSIGNLTNLLYMDLRRCSNVVELPSSIGNLTNLKHLLLSGCSSLLILPSSSGNLTNLQDLDLRECSNMVELPSSIGNLTNLEELNLEGCSSLLKLPSSIGSLTNLRTLDLSGCSILLKLPSSSRYLTNLRELHLSGCSSLVKIPSSIGNLHMLTRLNLQRCSKLEILPANISLGSLRQLDVTGCSQLRKFPEISTNIEELKLCGTLINEVPLSIKSWSQLKDLEIPYCKNLGEFPNVLNVIRVLELNNTEIKEFPPWFSGISRLDRLVLKKCRKLVSLPQLPTSLDSLVAENCDSLERLASSFLKSYTKLTFVNCWKLSEEAKDIIVQSSSSYHTTILPGREVPAFFTNQSTSGCLLVKLNKRCFPTTLRLKVCILLAIKGDKGARDVGYTYVYPHVMDKQSGHVFLQYNRDVQIQGSRIYLSPLLKEHLYTFEVIVRNVDSCELFLLFEKDNDKWEIAECGIRQL